MDSTAHNGKKYLTGLAAAAIIVGIIFTSGCISKEQQVGGLDACHSLRRSSKETAKRTGA